MPKHVKLPDGQIGIFGDDESNEQIRAKIEEKYPNAYPEPGVLPAMGRFARGAGRAIAGGVADIGSLGHVTGIPMFAPSAGRGIGSRGPSVAPKLEEFANAPTPSAAETAGWWGGEALQSLGIPGEVLPLGATARGVKAGGRYLWGKLAPKLDEVVKESARQTATQTGKQVAEQAVKKPRLRIKASGDVKEVTPEGVERTVRKHTMRRMEKLQERAAAKPPPTQEGVHQDYQDLLNNIGHHGVHHVAKYFANAMGIPTWTAHLIMMRGPRSVMDRGIATGVLGAERTMSGEAQKNERGKGTPKNNPPALSPYSGSPL